MEFLKAMVIVIISFFLCFFIYSNYDKIVGHIDEIVKETKKIDIPEINKYVKKDSYRFVQYTNNYIPNNYQDLLNIYYSAISNGWAEFSFYCPTEYSDCISDVRIISKNTKMLADINSYVSPYNSYSSIETSFNSAGEVSLSIKHLYSDEEISMIDKMINDIIIKNTTNNMSIYEKIRKIHDYIINNTYYDVDRATKNESSYDSNRMTGLLLEHYGVCSAYSDTMAIVLDKLGIKNYRISSDIHVWNALLFNNQWRHLDLTWDDPVTDTGVQILKHDYFMIDNKKINELDKGSLNHSFDKYIYLEFNY